jgi:hypothetical protein
MNTPTEVWDGVTVAVGRPWFWVGFVIVTILCLAWRGKL